MPEWLIRSLLPLVAFVLSVISAAAEKGFVDDTFITLQYARNLVEFGIPLWHVDLPPVEGFTSLGHMLLIAITYRIGFDPIWGNAMVIGGSYACLLVAFALATRSLSLPATALGFAVIGLNPDLLFWLRGGLDAVPYMTAFFATYLLYTASLRENRLSAAAAASIALLAIMRPEGMFVGLALLIFFWGTRTFLPLKNGRSSIIITVLCLAVVSLLTIWRLDTFGYPLPNTYYAKNSASIHLEIVQGATYFKNWLADSSGALMLTTLWLVFAGIAKPLHVLFIVGQVALVIIAGGDAHPAYRFFLPLLPLLALDAAQLFDRLRNTPSLVKVAFVVLILAPTLEFRVYGPSVGKAIDWIGANDLTATTKLIGLNASRHAHAAQIYQEILSPRTQIAATDVGAFAYFSGFPVLDTHGLNHPAIAHLPRPDNFLNLWGNYRLDYLIEANVPVVHIWFPVEASWSFREVASGKVECEYDAFRIAHMTGFFLEQLKKNYFCVSVRRGADEPYFMNFFVKKDRLDLLIARPDQVEQSDCLDHLRSQCIPRKR